MSSDRFKVNNIINFGGKHIYRDDRQPSQYHTFSEDMITKLIYHIMGIFVAVLGSFGLIAIGVLYAIVFKGDRVTFIATELPFVDSETNFGLVINLLEQSFLTLISIISNITIEIGVCLVDNGFSAIPQIIYLDSKDLDTELTINGMSFEAIMRLRNIFMKIRDYFG